MKEEDGFQSLIRLLILYNSATQLSDPRSGIRQLLTPQPTTKAGFIPITSTVLAAIVACWVAPSVAPTGGKTRFTEDKTVEAKEWTKKCEVILEGLEEIVTGSKSLKWNSLKCLTSNPETLWDVVFPGISAMLDNRVIFRRSGVSNGHSIHIGVNDREKATASSQPNTSPRLKFGYGDWRSATLENPTDEKQRPASLHDLAGQRDKSQGDGLQSIKGFKGEFHIS
jgi:hypothetical protein